MKKWGGRRMGPGSGGRLVSVVLSQSLPPLLLCVDLPSFSPGSD